MTGQALGRLSRGALCALLLGVVSCAKKKEASRDARVVPAVPPADPPLVDITAGTALASTPAPAKEILPAWAQEPAHFFMRDGIRFASAVGSVQVGNPALAEAAAEGRARGELLRLIRGAQGVGEVQGSLPGARTTDSFTSNDGTVYVRVEVTAPGS
jgi:hypothetical protein